MRNSCPFTVAALALFALMACDETTYECDVYQYDELLWSNLEFKAESAEAAEAECEQEHDESGVSCRHCKEK